MHHFLNCYCGLHSVLLWFLGFFVFVRGKMKSCEVRTLRDSMSYVSVGQSSGTLYYMSPQQLLGEAPAATDDIYALGATLYELLSSKPPFFGGDIATQVREVTPPWVAERREKLGIAGDVPYGSLHRGGWFRRQ